MLYALYVRTVARVFSALATPIAHVWRLDQRRLDRLIDWSHTLDSWSTHTHKRALVFRRVCYPCMVRMDATGWWDLSVDCHGHNCGECDTCCSFVEDETWWDNLVRDPGALAPDSPLVHLGAYSITTCASAAMLMCLSRRSHKATIERTFHPRNDAARLAHRNASTS